MNFRRVYYSGLFCTWPRTEFPMYTETWGDASSSGVLALCPERQGSFLFSPPRCSAVATFCKPGGVGGGLGPGEWGHCLPSPPTVCLVATPVSSCCFWIHHSPWWKAWWGWWGRCHFGPACCTAPSLGSARSSVWCWPSPATRSVFPTTHQSGLYSGSAQAPTP